MPRSRSSILLESLCLFYDIPILKENPDIDQSITDFLSETLNHKDGVIRFHPNGPILHKKQSFEYFDSFNFEQYDKIFFTDRKNSTDYICSIVLARTLGIFTYKDHFIPTIEPMYFDYDKHHSLILDYILGRSTMSSIKKYINYKNIKADIVCLDYDDIPVFIDTNYNNNASITHVQTNYDYKKIFINYDEITYYHNELDKIMRV